MPYINVGANYNILAISFYIIGIIIFFTKKDCKYSEVLQGILIYFILFTKQNIGTFYITAIIIVYFINYKSKAINKLLKIGFISFVLCMINILFMYLEGNLYGFINYTFLGMQSFTRDNFAIDKDAQILVISEIAIGIVAYIVAIMFIKKEFFKSSSDKIKEINSNYLSQMQEETSYVVKNIIIFSIFLNLSIFPILNLYHTSFAIIINVIILIYISDKSIIDSEIKIETIILKIIGVIIYIFINIYGIICGIRSIENVKIVDKGSVYYFSNMSKEVYYDMNDIISYIEQRNDEGTEVIILSQNSALYMLPLGQNHREFDLAFRGNLGYNGEEELVNKLKNLENTEILLNSNMYWQEIEEVRLYVISHFQKIGNIGEYHIFKNKD